MDEPPGSLDRAERWVVVSGIAVPGGACLGDLGMTSAEELALLITVVTLILFKLIAANGGVFPV